MKQDSATWKFKTQKSDGNIYSDFEEKIGAFPGVNFIHNIYHFEAWEVRSPTFQMMHKSDKK